MTLLGAMHSMAGKPAEWSIGICGMTMAMPALLALKTCVEFCTAIGNSSSLSRFAKQEFLPGNGADLDDFIRNATVTQSHQTCTAKMGDDPLSVVDSHLKLYGIENLRIADGVHSTEGNDWQHYGTLRRRRGSEPPSYCGKIIQFEASDRSWPYVFLGMHSASHAERWVASWKMASREASAASARC